MARGRVDPGKGLFGLFRVSDVDLEEPQKKLCLPAFRGQGQGPTDKGKGGERLARHLVCFGHEKAKFGRFAFLLKKQPIGIQGPAKLVDVRRKSGDMSEKPDVPRRFSEKFSKELEGLG